MPYIALVLIGLVGLFLLLRLVATMPPAQLARGIYVGGAVIGVGTIVFLAAIGREALAFGLAGLALPFLRRWGGRIWGGRIWGGRIWGGRSAATGPGEGQASEIVTAWLKMILDHDTGRIDGTVLKGVHAGHALADLGLAELVALWRGMASEDPPSAQLLEAYLDRVHEGWRGSAEPASGEARMGRAEALRILGLEGEPTAADIRAAHHRLMMANHPDHGGSAYLAAKINQARDILLESRH
jgi:hypothetical protein